MTTTAPKTIKINPNGSWELVCALNAPSFRTTNVPENIANAIMYGVWHRQDGYGETGFTPPQGWDWSGIRDSSHHAKNSIASFCAQELLRIGIAEVTYVQVC